MRIKSSISPLLVVLPLIAIAAPNGSGDSATTTHTSIETLTVTHTRLHFTVTSTYAPSTLLSYFPIIAATQSAGGPLPDIPNPTSTGLPDISPAGSDVVTQILVAASSTTSSTSTKSSSTVSVGFPVAHPSGTGVGTGTTPLVIASATSLATPSPPIATYTGAAAGGMKGCGVWSSGMVLVGVAVGFAAGLL
ncbi:hypothetical protein MMC22_010667 [Lobaria immixta]|nr:hypothetical protein [Lobaria immixta]